MTEKYVHTCARGPRSAAIRGGQRRRRRRRAGRPCRLTRASARFCIYSFMATDVFLGHGSRKVPTQQAHCRGETQAGETRKKQRLSSSHHRKSQHHPTGSGTCAGVFPTTPLKPRGQKRITAGCTTIIHRPRVGVARCHQRQKNKKHRANPSISSIDRPPPPSSLTLPTRGLKGREFRGWLSRRLAVW